MVVPIPQTSHETIAETEKQTEICQEGIPTRDLNSRDIVPAVSDEEAPSFEKLAKGTQFDQFYSSPNRH
jgi:hypothetical protein